MENHINPRPNTESRGIGMASMNIWCEFEKDAFSYFDQEFFNKGKAHERLGKIPDLSVFSVVGSMLFSLSDINDFKDFCGRKIQKIFTDQNYMNDYKLYLFANRGAEGESLRVARYKKVWKSLQTKWPLDSFNKGPEIEVEIDGELCFSSIAHFRLEDFLTALYIVSNNPRRCTIIASKKDDFLSEKALVDIFGIAFDKCSRYADKIDYFGLSIHLCPEDDMIFRWGDSSEEAEIALILKNGILEMPSWLAADWR